MQFIPSTWQKYAADGSGDGVADPHNIYDAALATGRYLCAGGTDPSNPEQLAAAIYRYNHSLDYVKTVLRWARVYQSGGHPVDVAHFDTASDSTQGVGAASANGSGRQERGPATAPSPPDDEPAEKPQKPPPQSDQPKPPQNPPPPQPPRPGSCADRPELLCRVPVLEDAVVPTLEGRKP